MTNINPIQIFPGINDLPVEATALEGCNGSAVVQRVNKLITTHNKPFEVHGDCNTVIEYWVDTVDGLDTNNGLTNTTPYKTLQKALDNLESKAFDDCYYVYIYIKGTVVGELDFTNLRSWYMSSSWAGALTLDKWPEETAKWTYEPGRWADLNDYTYKGSWRCDHDRALYVDVYNCKFDIYSLISFSNLSIGFSYCEFNSLNSYVGDVSSVYVMFYDCKKIRFFDCSLTLDTKHFRIVLDNSHLTVQTEITYANPNNKQCSIRLSSNSSLTVNFNRLHTAYATKTIDLEDDGTGIFHALQEDSYKFEGIEANNFKGTIRFGKISEVFSHEIFIPNPTNANYLIALPYKPCLFKNIVFSAAGGSLTARPNPTNGNFTYNMTFVDRQTVRWIENLDFVIPYARAFGVSVELTNVTGVTDLFIQANFFPLNYLG